MNILRLTLAVLTVAAAAHLHAAERATALSAVHVHGNDRLVVDCRDERLPNLRAVGQVLETNNASQIYAERERVIHIAHRECMRGAANVVFEHDAGASVPALALAGTPTQ